MLAAFCNADKQEVIAWENTNNVKYPGIAVENGGDSLRVIYGDGKIFGVPAICLIRPDGKIVEKDLADEAACISDPYVDSLNIILKYYKIGSTSIDNVIAGSTASGAKVGLVTTKLLVLYSDDADWYTGGIYEPNGKMVYPISAHIKAGTNTLTMKRELAPGIYYLDLLSNRGTRTHSKVLYRQ